jgi:hypothetical protein
MWAGIPPGGNKAAGTGGNHVWIQTLSLDRRNRLHDRHDCDRAMVRLSGHAKRLSAGEARKEALLFVNKK